MESNKNINDYSLFPGYDGQKSDARSVYIQNEMDNIILDKDGHVVSYGIWIRFPKDFWPSH